MNKESVFVEDVEKFEDLLVACVKANNFKKNTAPDTRRFESFKEKFLKKWAKW